MIPELLFMLKELFWETGIAENLLGKYENSWDIAFAAC